MRRKVPLLVVLAALAVACATGGTPAGSTVSTTTSSIMATTVTEPGPLTLPSCDEVKPVTAPPDAYRDDPLYVANEMPVDEVRAWAELQPGFESIWIDREHNGWITVAFSEAADLRQADLEAKFPGVGVVAVEVDWSMSQLAALQNRVFRELRGWLDSFGTFTADDKGMVVIQVGVLTDEIQVQLGERLAGERVCLSGPLQSEVPPEGPQPQAGEGWRLLLDAEGAGSPYRTGIAWDPESLAMLWEQIGINQRLPEVDFGHEVVVWFGAVYGSGCAHIRLDDVVVVDGVLHPLIVLPGPPAGCNLDANPHAYVVAVERSKLPPGRFVIQLQAEDPPRGATEERTVVDADLSQPGSLASPDQVGPDPDFPPPFFHSSGDFVEPEFPAPYRMDVSCGIEWLGELNGYAWRTTEEQPLAWGDLIKDDGTLETSILMRTDPEPHLEVTAGGATITYRPTTQPLPSCP